jgi:hypothetical protein
MKAATTGIIVALLSTAAAGRRRAMRFNLVYVGVVALNFIAPCLEARAEATYLSCSGTVRMIRVGILSPEQPSTFFLSVDLERKTIIVDDHEPVPLVGNPSINPIVFGLSPQTTFGVRSGTLNRVTGTAAVHIIKEGLQVLNGMCKPVEYSRPRPPSASSPVIPSAFPLRADEVIE